MRIIVDAMGGDNAPMAAVEGAVMAAREFDTRIILTGRVEEILKCFEALGEKELPRGIEIADAPEVVEMEDDPASVIRTKPDSSMAVGLKMLRDGAADAMVSAGSTGALLSGATLITKRIRGIRRAALAPFLPNKGDGVLLIDCGANAECNPEYLLQFAFMGSYYAKTMLGFESPSVGLLNIGAEETKGTELQRGSYALLRAAGDAGRINFVGNVEAREVMLGACDVIVTDGFSGNIFLKGMEGVGMFIMSEVKNVFMKSKKTKIAAAMVKDELSALKKKMDPSEIGGTALLGISKPVIKAHGSSDAYAIRSAIMQAINTAKSGVTALIEENIGYMRLSGGEE
ncbi:MAG: phosphate acyltransferase PlsX [Oscillospiraceae bacterium]|nr:phosphate acyltransferase PlsX [Oscillospiraceae bacterium]